MVLALGPCGGQKLVWLGGSAWCLSPSSVLVGDAWWGRTWPPLDGTEGACNCRLDGVPVVVVASQLPVTGASQVGNTCCALGEPADLGQGVSGQNMQSATWLLLGASASWRGGWGGAVRNTLEREETGLAGLTHKAPPHSQRPPQEKRPQMKGGGAHCSRGRGRSRGGRWSGRACLCARMGCEWALPKPTEPVRK